MTDVPFLPAAMAEFLRAIDYYNEEEPGLGSDFLIEVERAVRRISTFPAHGSPYLAGTRRVVLRRFPYSVVYSADNDVLLVVAVAHHRRRPGYWTRRVQRGPKKRR